MKRKFVATILALACALSCIFAISGCGFFTFTIVTGYDGTYYLYENGELNKDYYVTLNDGEWTTNHGDISTGTYKIDSGIITFSTTEIMGIDVGISSGFIDRGGLEFRGDTFYKEGMQRESVNGNY